MIDMSETFAEAGDVYDPEKKIWRNTSKVTAAQEPQQPVAEKVIEDANVAAKNDMESTWQALQLIFSNESWMNVNEHKIVRIAGNDLFEKVKSILEDRGFHPMQERQDNDQFLLGINRNEVGKFHELLKNAGTRARQLIGKTRFSELFVCDQNGNLSDIEGASICYGVRVDSMEEKNVKTLTSALCMIGAKFISGRVKANDQSVSTAILLPHSDGLVKSIEADPRYGVKKQPTAEAKPSNM